MVPENNFFCRNRASLYRERKKSRPEAAIEYVSNVRAVVAVLSPRLWLRFSRRSHCQRRTPRHHTTAEIPRQRLGWAIGGTSLVLGRSHCRAWQAPFSCQGFYHVALLSLQHLRYEGIECLDALGFAFCFAHLCVLNLHCSVELLFFSSPLCQYLAPFV